MLRIVCCLQHMMLSSAPGVFLQHRLWTPCRLRLLVGPRPLPVYEVELFQPWQHVRHARLPGITGFWQVYGRSTVSHEDAILMDIFYVVNWSLTLDIHIVLRTLYVVLSGKGAV